MDIAKFFYRPQTVGEILEGRTATRSGASDLVGKIEGLKEDEALVVTEPIIPGGYGRYPLFEDPQNFLKRGELVRLRTPQSIREAVEQKAGPARLRIDAFENLSEDRAYCGFSWTGLRDGRKRIVHLDDVILGTKLFVYSSTARPKDDRIEIRGYDNHHRVRDVGAVFICSVPSRSQEFSDRPHYVKLSGVPSPRHYLQYATWFDLEGEHLCRKKANWEITYRFVQNPVVFCPHEIAAFLAISKMYCGQTGRMPLTPFPLPTEMTVAFWRKLTEQVVCEVDMLDNNKNTRLRKDGTPRRKKRPTNFADRERLLWQLVARHGHKATLFAKGKKFRDYKWV